LNLTIFTRNQPDLGDHLSFCEIRSNRKNIF